MIEFFIDVARECFNIGNFNSLMAIICEWAGSGLESPVHRPPEVGAGAARQAECKPGPPLSSGRARAGLSEGLGSPMSPPQRSWGATPFEASPAPSGCLVGAWWYVPRRRERGPSAGAQYRMGPAWWEQTHLTVMSTSSPSPTHHVTDRALQPPALVRVQPKGLQLNRAPPVPEAALSNSASLF